MMTHPRTSALLATGAVAAILAFVPMTAHGAGMTAGAGGSGNIGSSGNVTTGKDGATANISGRVSASAGGGGAGNIGSSQPQATSSTVANGTGTATATGAQSAVTERAALQNNNGIGAGALNGTPDFNAPSDTVANPAATVTNTSGAVGGTVSQNGLVRAQNKGSNINMSGSQAVETVHTSDATVAGTVRTSSNVNTNGASPSSANALAASLSEKNFSAIDADHDGAITAAEMNMYTYKAGDLNHDGKIDSGEWNNYQTTFAVPPTAYNQYAVNGALTESGYDQLVATSGFYKSFDTNNDGRISSSEYTRGLNRNHLDVRNGVVYPTSALTDSNQAVRTPLATTGAARVNGSATILPGKL